MTTKVLAYTSPARGHLYPTVPILLELARRGHEVVLRTMQGEVDHVARTGIRVGAIAPAIESIEHDDYEVSSPKAALDRAVRTFVARAAHEIADLDAALRRERPDLLLVDFKYACAERPESVVMVGPLAWEPPVEPPAWLARDDRPLVLVTCSTEYQADGALVSTALDALAGEDVLVVATTAAIDPATFRAPENARVERFVPHAPLLSRAACVVCHGGMGITQKALAAGVPVCVVPFGRDQLEVARRVEVADAGVRLPAKKLTVPRLRHAIRAARAKKGGAERIAAGFRAAGGAARAADELEALLAHDTQNTRVESRAPRGREDA